MDIETLKKWIKESDAILIGAGAGLSDAAGIHYSGKKFETDFQDFIQKYRMKDLYTSSFYPFSTEEEKWAYWAKHIYFSYFETKETELYQILLKLVSGKEYFVLTTNTDGQFLRNGFDPKRIFEIQGSYAKLQCSKPCHQKLYDDEKMVMEMLSNIDLDLKIPSRMVPKCPVCGENMNVNLRCDDTFVEDDHWHESANSYDAFLNQYKTKKLLLLEFGVGFNTPGIIRYPFEDLTYHHPKIHLVRFNKKYPDVPEEIEKRSIFFDENILDILKDVL